jgi:putative ABC transport system permease protein
MSIKKNLTISFRRLIADKTNTFISITGLILGLGIVAVVLVFILNELNYNKSFTNTDRICRVLNYSTNDNKTWATTPYALGEAVKDNFAEIDDVFCQYNIGDIEVEQNNSFITEPEVLSTGSSFFNALGIRILQGSLSDFDEANGKIVLSKHLSEKYFGTQNAVGQHLTFRFKGKEFPMEVVAVYADIPNNSTIKASIVTNINFGLEVLAANVISNTTKPSVDEMKQNWGMSLFVNYLVLKVGVDKNAFQEKLKKLGEENATKDVPLSLSLQPLSDMYFSSGQILNN